MLLYVITKGTSIYDINKISGFFDPLPLVCIQQLIYSMKFTQPSLVRLFFWHPLPPPGADIFCTCPLTQTVTYHKLMDTVQSKRRRRIICRDLYPHWQLAILWSTQECRNCTRFLLGELELFWQKILSD